MQKGGVNIILAWSYEMNMYTLLLKARNMESGNWEAEIISSSRASGKFLNLFESQCSDL